jgi:hypothetical protein
MKDLAPLKKADLPNPPSLKKLIGPSFIILGLGLGSGELILWPYLSSNFGLGIIWASVLGITLQFFLNMEIERYTLVTGESIFVGLTRKFKTFSPVWFILSTLIPWMWPGIIAASATVFAASFGFSYSKYIGIALLLLIGIIFSVGSVIYKTQEKLQKIIIFTGIPFIFLLTFIFAKPTDWQALLMGISGRGNGFWFLPAGLPIATFLGALAYAGAGGNLNLAQSYYVKEKGYGMGKYAGRITALSAKKKEELSLEGTTFEPTPQNIKIFKLWWKRVNIEHAIVFWATGAFTMMMLSLLAFTTVFGNPNVSTGISFVIEEAKAISLYTYPAVGKLFLVVAGIMLFGTQFSVLGSTSRIMSENLVLTSPDKFKIQNLSKYFFVFLWLQIIAGITIFLVGFSEPLTLVITSAVLNAITMFVYSGMIFKLNNSLEKQISPSLIRNIALSAAFLFYGGFSLYTILQKLNII